MNNEELCQSITEENFRTGLKTANVGFLKNLETNKFTLKFSFQDPYASNFFESIGIPKANLESPQNSANGYICRSLGEYEIVGDEAIKTLIQKDYGIFPAYAIISRELHTRSPTDIRSGGRQWG